MGLALPTARLFARISKVLDGSRCVLMEGVQAFGDVGVIQDTLFKASF